MSVGGRSVERRGIDSVLSGFQMYDLPMFSLWGDAKMLKFSYCGDEADKALEILAENLEALQASGSQAIYSLRVHKQVDKDGYITNNTPYIGSFNFKLCDNVGYAQGQQLQPGSIMPFQSVPNAAVMEEIKKLNDRLDAFAAQQDEKEPDLSPFEKTMSGIGGILEIPIVQNVVAGIFSKFLGMTIPNTNVELPGEMIAGIPEGEMSTEAWNQINSAVNVLYHNDKDLPQHLTKLAQISVQDPTTFGMLIGMLNKK